MLIDVYYSRMLICFAVHALTACLTLFDIAQLSLADQYKVIKRVADLQCVKTFPPSVNEKS